MKLRGRSNPNYSLTSVRLGCNFIKNPLKRSVLYCVLTFLLIASNQEETMAGRKIIIGFKRVFSMKLANYMVLVI